MRLFSRQENLVKTETSYQDCLDYLRDLDQQNYNKLLKVVTIYRDADKAVKKLLNIKDTPISDPDYYNRLEDTELGDFLEDDLPKAKKVEVK